MSRGLLENEVGSARSIKKTDFRGLRSHDRRAGSARGARNRPPSCSKRLLRNSIDKRAIRRVMLGSSRRYRNARFDSSIDSLSLSLSLSVSLLHFLVFYAARTRRLLITIYLFPLSRRRVVIDAKFSTVRPRPHRRPTQIMEHDDNYSFTDDSSHVELSPATPERCLLNSKNYFQRDNDSQRMANLLASLIKCVSSINRNF